MSTATISNTDSSLEKNVIDELEFDPSLDASDISVNVKQGVVTLSGTVKFYTEKLRAERAVKRVKGVHGIAEELKVEPLGTHQRTDGDITKTALTLLAWDISIPKDRITVTVDHGWLMLDGYVDWDFQKRNVERALRSMPGVVGIENRIAVMPQISTDDVSARIRRTFERSADIDAGHIQVEAHDGEVTLRGTVHTWTQHDEATRAAFSLSGVVGVKNLITLS